MYAEHRTSSLVEINRTHFNKRTKQFVVYKAMTEKKYSYVPGNDHTVYRLYLDQGVTPPAHADTPRNPAT